MLVTAQQSLAKAVALGSPFFRHCGTENVWFHPRLAGTSVTELRPPEVPSEDVRKTFGSKNLLI